MRLVMGELADALLLGSQRALPEATQAAGYQFRHPHLEPALEDLFRSGSRSLRV
jgi:NAD dependent epimerase/dehydratase family enzyme